MENVVHLFLGEWSLLTASFAISSDGRRSHVREIEFEPILVK